MQNTAATISCNNITSSMNEYTTFDDDVESTSEPSDSNFDYDWHENLSESFAQINNNKHRQAADIGDLDDSKNRRMSYPLPLGIAAGSLAQGIPTRLKHICPGLVRLTDHKEKPYSLGKEYEIKIRDVLCDRNGMRELEKFRHPGNERFRTIIQIRAERYSKAKTKFTKSAIVREVIEAVRMAGGNFVRCGSEEDGVASPTECIDIGDHKAREKVGHALRAQIKSHHKVSALLHNRTTRQKSGNSTTTSSSCALKKASTKNKLIVDVGNTELAEHFSLVRFS